MEMITRFTLTNGINMQLVFQLSIQPVMVQLMFHVRTCSRHSRFALIHPFNLVAEQDVVTFFETTVSLFQTLPTYQWLSAAGIVPSNDQTYNLSDLQAVAQANQGFNAVWNCKNGILDEVWWGFVASGGFSSGTIQFVATDALGTSTCPE